jgi:hypothetical protein
MARSTFPTRIKQMIESAWHNSENATDLTERINQTATARKHKVRYTVRQIAAALAWHTIRDRYNV